MSAEMLPAADPVLVPPRGLVLDFGGVVVTTTTLDRWQGALADDVVALLIDEGVDEVPSRDHIVSDITDGAEADRAWKNAMSRRFAPEELDPGLYWGDFIATDWPEGARSVVVRHAHELCRLQGHHRQRREERTGLRDLLAYCKATGIPVAIASNALSGQVHREYLEEAGLTSAFAAQLYSDEEQVRKPNPALITRAAAAIGCVPEQVWYVGDTYDRDVVAGRRAGVGAVVRMNVSNQKPGPYRQHLPIDLEVSDPADLLVQMSQVVEFDGRSLRSGPMPLSDPDQSSDAPPQNFPRTETIDDVVLLKAVREAAADVTQYLTGIDGGAAKRDYKRDIHDIVTVHDQESETIAKRSLRRHIAWSDILGEEDGRDTAADADDPRLDRGPSEVTFIIDPIDGTANFAAGLPLYCISIAAQLNGETIAGVIRLPAMGLEFYADNSGAYLQRYGVGGLQAHGAPQRLGVVAHRAEKECAISSGYPSVVDLDEDREASLRHYGEICDAVGTVRSLGAGAIELAFVAAGWLDATFGTRTQPWDIAAGVHLIQRSGGTVRHFPMDSDPNRPDVHLPGYIAIGPGRQLPTLTSIVEQIQHERLQVATDAAPGGTESS